jgi:hypothetical protein
VSEQQNLSPAQRRRLRDAARTGDQERRKAIKEAMRAGWSGEDADELNWLDVAVNAYPASEAAAHTLYGVAVRLIDRLAEVTDEERGRLLDEVLL